MGFHQNEIIRVLIIHTHAALCDGLRMLIDNNPNMEVVGLALNRSEALLLVSQKKPDVILMELDFEGEEGLMLLAELREIGKASRVLVLTGTRHSKDYYKAIKVGAMGLVLNKHGSDVLIKAIDKVHRGEVWIDRSMVGTILSEMGNGSGVDPQEEKIASLTERERRVITLVGEGLKNKQIAERLFVCETTVSHRLSSIFAKLELSDRLELVIYAFRHGLAKMVKD